MTRMQRAVHVVGVGMIPFTKPGASDPYTVMGARAAKLALEDAGVNYKDVQQAYVGYVYGDSTSGQAAIYGVGLTGIPVFNVNNNCSSGSSALFLARQAVESGMVECAIALGFDQMVPGALKGAYDDRPSPMSRFAEVMTAHQGYQADAPRAAQFFGGAGRDYIAQYGIRKDTFGRISVKARQHAARNPLAVFRQTLTLDEVMAAPTVFDPLTRYQCCPPTCGAAAAIVCSVDFAKKHKLRKSKDVAGITLIHSEVNIYSWREWQRDHPDVMLKLDRGPRFDRSFMAISAAVDGLGLGLESRLLVERELQEGRLVLPFGAEGPTKVCHHLTYLKAKAHLPKMKAFREWLFEELEASQP